MDQVIRLTILIALFILPASILNAQVTEPEGKKKIEILHADLMANRGEMRQLLGNVRFRHKETYMTCDSAHFFPNKNLVEAYSKVHIFKGDTLHLYGDYLLYDSEAEYAYVTDSVLLIDNETSLYTDYIEYDMIKETATYTTGGRIINEDNVLTSIIGIYYTESEIFNFKDSVKLVNPDYTMYSDTLQYNTVTEVAYFLGPSEIIGDSIYARCNRGWYDTRNELSLLMDDAFIDNEIQIVTGDSLYYETDNGFGTAHYNVTIRDKEEDIIVKGNKSWYYSEPERFMITDSAQFIQVNGDDYLYLHADTLWSVTIEDSTMNYRLVRAFYDCRIYSEDLQAKCDSLSYTFRDSVIRLYNEPVLWSDANQLFADSMVLYTKNKEMYKMELYNNAFVIEEVDSVRFNQLKGKNLTGYFRENELHKIEIRGNSEKIYFAVEEDELVGVDHSTCVNMDIYIEEGKISEIYMLDNPEGTLDPPLYKEASSRRLENFYWYKAIRPKNRFDIFRR
ncbi:MAG: OstA-like protein [Bacteroidales bacterium]|nr:OstA-like protein [Bacteroidales bacterium]